MSSYNTTPIKYKLVTKNQSVVYVPLATANTYGLVKAGDGFVINNGKIEFKYKSTNTLSFTTKDQFEKWLSGEFQREDNFLTTELKIGDIIRLEEKNTPDYWCKSISSPMTLDDFLVCGSEQNYIRYDDEQNLSDEHKQIARKNIGALELEDLSHFVDETSKQTITGDKNFTGSLTKNNINVATLDDIEDIKDILLKVETAQLIELGEQVISKDDWSLNDNLYQYKFYNEQLKNALFQILIITPDKETIDNLNSNDIFVYPEIEMIQESENVAYGVIKTDKKPEFDMYVNVKLQGTKIDADTQGITASQIIFTPTNNISSKKVQTAIEEVQTNLNNLETQYNSEKESFVKLDENGKIYSTQLPGYVDDVIEAFLKDGVMWTTKIDDGDDAIYADSITPTSGKIYVDLNTNKTYRWSGTQYTVIGDDLAIGETTGTAYDGAKGKRNADNITNLTQTVNKEIEDITQEIEDMNNEIKEIRDELSLSLNSSPVINDNGILKFENNTVCVIKDLFNNNSGVTELIPADYNINENDLLKVECGWINEPKRLVDFVFTNTTGKLYSVYGVFFVKDNKFLYDEYKIEYNASRKISATRIRHIISAGSDGFVDSYSEKKDFLIYKISKVIK